MFQIELDFVVLVFVKGGKRKKNRKPGEKTLEQGGDNNTINQHVTLG